MDIVGYTDPLSVRPGERLRVMVSSRAPRYRAAVVRLIHGDDNPAGPGFRAEPVPSSVDGEHDGVRQELDRGSYLRVGDRPALRPGKALTVAAWVKPTAPGGHAQVVASKWDPKRGGWVLGFDERGRLSLRLGGGRSGRSTTVAVKSPVRRGEWYFVAARIDTKAGRAEIVQRAQRQWPGDPTSGTATSTRLPSPLHAAEAPLLVAATWDDNGSGELVAVDHFNGKIEAPCLFDRRLADEELDALAEGEVPKGVVGYWHFGRKQSSVTVPDISPTKAHGTLVNMPTRAVTGHLWDGTVHDPGRAPEQYAAVHFHDDDREDADWDPAFEVEVGSDWRSGVYAVHFQAGEAEDYVPFFVCPPAGSRTADIAFLAPTFSYMAYGNEQLTARVMEDPTIKAVFAGAELPYPTQPEDRYVVDNRLLSMYDLHSDGSGVCYASRLLPIVNMRPKVDAPLLANLQGSPHQFNADLHLVDWLEQKGYDYDVLTDDLLHEEGLDLLDGYGVILTGTHPEYWSGAMLDALEAYLGRGGKLMYLGGNGFYWVTSVHRERPHVIEIRRWTGTRAWEPGPGEYHHSTTGELGGPWRYRGRAPQKLVGVGFTAQGFDQNGAYRRQPGADDPRVRFVLEGVEDEVFGDVPSLVMNQGAAGFELDRADEALGTPPGTVVLASSFGHSDSYQHAVEEVLAMDGSQGGTVNPLVRADMTYTEYPNGGAVFSTGSIAWCGCLSAKDYDNDVSRITENVLNRFTGARKRSRREREA